MSQGLLARIVATAHCTLQQQCRVNSRSSYVNKRSSCFLLLICHTLLFFQILAVYENFHIGQVLCASCPDSRTLITGGTSTVIETDQVFYMTYCLVNSLQVVLLLFFSSSVCGTWWRAAAERKNRRLFYTRWEPVLWYFFHVITLHKKAKVIIRKNNFPTKNLYFSWKALVNWK